MEYRICKYCILEKGITDSELKEEHFETNEDLANHIESEHHISVCREDETEEACKERFYKAYPEAESTGTCRCPECKLNRRIKQLLHTVEAQN